MKKILTASAIVAALGLSFTTMAMENNMSSMNKVGDAYIEGSVGWNWQGTSFDSNDVNFDKDNSHLGGRVAAGYLFNIPGSPIQVGPEIGYGLYGDIKNTKAAQQFEDKLKGFDGNLVLNYKASDSLDVFVKGGAVRLSHSANVFGSEASAKWHPQAGLGIGVKVYEGLYVRAAYTRIFEKEVAKDAKIQVDNLSLGLAYKF